MKNENEINIIEINKHLDDIEERLRTLTLLSSITLKIQDGFDDLKNSIDNLNTTVSTLDISIDSLTTDTKTFNCSSAFTDFEINHELSRIPTGYIILNKNSDAEIFDGETEWTSSAIYIQSTEPCSGTILII